MSDPLKKYSTDEKISLLMEIHELITDMKTIGENEDEEASLEHWRDFSEALANWNDRADKYLVTPQRGVTA